MQMRREVRRGEGRFLWLLRQLVVTVSLESQPWPQPWLPMQPLPLPLRALQMVWVMWANNFKELQLRICTKIGLGCLFAQNIYWSWCCYWFSCGFDVQCLHDIATLNFINHFLHWVNINRFFRNLSLIIVIHWHPEHQYRLWEHHLWYVNIRSVLLCIISFIESMYYTVYTT